MAVKRAPRSRGRALFRMLWIPASWSVPAALFFGTIFGRGIGGYLLALRMSLVFSYTISLTMTAISRFVAPRLFPPTQEARFTSRSLLEGLLYMGSSIAASFVAAGIVHATMLPGFLGSPRQFAIAGMFALLFSSLAMAVVYAFSYYQRALDRARSEEELRLARRIQRSFLISEFPDLGEIEVHASNLSSRHVSGDFYDVVPAGPGAWLLAIADVSGKGVPAALLTSMLQASLRTQAGGPAPVGGILAAINRLVVGSAPAGQFATFFLARLELDPPRLLCSNAGHNHPVVVRPDGTIRTLGKGGVVVGILEDATFEEEAVALAPGDRVVLYTDGVSEAANAAGEMYGEERLHGLAASLPPELSAREICDRILESVREFLDGLEAGDDITLMALRVRGSSPAPSPAGGHPATAG